ncbi:hypothetical protein [Fictibacillus sp. FJAT-27399]|uniref:hypothetical protein n=1 Tax=Fictibacillus sp. FJAT-27399 TaxID=1729689 RepID=UPI000783516B|nr:hypothetical protein [Fictibacillus sp. FJAT-27399]
MKSIFQTTAIFPELSDVVINPEPEEHLEELELGITNNLSYFFVVVNGRSVGEKNYNEGYTPYISSGDSTNSIVRLVQANEAQTFEGYITVTAFGKAYVQPWPFMARGNGGSSVRVLVPRFKMSFKELVWFAAQINIQQWRFFYARMAIKTRIIRLVLESPSQRLNDDEFDIKQRITDFRTSLDAFSEI